MRSTTELYGLGEMKLNKEIYEARLKRLFCAIDETSCRARQDRAAINSVDSIGRDNFYSLFSLIWQDIEN